MMTEAAGQDRTWPVRTDGTLLVTVSSVVNVFHLTAFELQSETSA